MKKLIYSCLLLALMAVSFSCSKDSNNNNANGPEQVVNVNLISAKVAGTGIALTDFVSSKEFVQGSAKANAAFIRGTSATISNDTLYIRGIGSLGADSVMLHLAIKLPAGNALVGIHPIRYDRNTVAEQAKGAVAFFGNQSLYALFNPYTATVSGELEIRTFDAANKTISGTFNFSQTMFAQTIAITNGSLQKVRIY